MVCGKIASGKSSLTSELGQVVGTVVISEDEWLSALFAEEMRAISDYVRCTKKLHKIMGPHVASVLKAGASVVLDFQANTVDARNWMRGILEQTDASHVLHYLDVPDEVCLERLRSRYAQGDHQFAVTDEQFYLISRYFVAPSPDEKFNVFLHT